MYNYNMPKANTFGNVANSFASVFSCAKNNNVKFSDTVINTVSILLCVIISVISIIGILDVIILATLIIIINLSPKRQLCNDLDCMM